MPKKLSELPVATSVTGTEIFPLVQSDVTKSSTLTVLYTWLTGLFGLKSGKLSQFSATSSAELAGVISDETGTGALVLNDGPVLVAPELGTPTSGVTDNLTTTTTVTAITDTDFVDTNLAAGGKRKILWTAVKTYLATTFAALAGSASQVFSVAAPSSAAHAVRADGVMGRNKIINGRFQVNQRAYVSAAALAIGAYGHDRWKAGAAGGDYSFTQNAADTTITIAAGKSLIQVIEDTNVSDTAYVLSWSGTAQARYAVDSATPAGSYAASPVLITGQTVGTVMSIEFNEGTLGDVQLESGAIATPFEARHYAAEQALCLRYYERRTSTAVGERVAAGFSDTTTTAVLTVSYSPKRIDPTISVSAVSDFIVRRQGASSIATTNITASVSRLYGDSALTATVAAGLTVGEGVILFFSASGKHIDFSSEL